MRDIDAFELERYFARWEFNVRWNLCASDCETLTIAELLAMEEGASQRFYSLPLGYTESQGHPSLREQISRLYTRVNPEDIVVFSGAEEAILLTMQAILSPGDHVAITFPAYQSLYSIAESIGCQVQRWELVEEEEWHPDTDELQQYFTDGLKLLSINTPHNPTGFQPSSTWFKRVIEACRERNVIVFSDEVYRFGEHDAGDRLPAAADLWEGAVSLGVMSKPLGLPGLRIGWLAVRNPDIRRAICRLKDYTTICNSAPSEFLATVALRHKDRILVRNLQIISDNLRLLDGFFQRRADSFKWHRPKAGAIAFPRLRAGSSAAWCRKLIEHGILLLPSSAFHYNDAHFRIGFGRANMPEALMRLDEVLG